MPVKQSTFFHKKTLPLIMKVVEGKHLLNKWLQLWMDQYGFSKQKSLKKDFLSAYNQVKKLNNDEIQQIDQTQKPNVLQRLVKLGSSYRKIKSMIQTTETLFKFYSDVKNTVQKHADKNYSNEYNDQVLIDDINYNVETSVSGTVLAFQKAIAVPIYNFNKMLEEKIRPLVANFWGEVVDSILLPNWQDPVDVTAWVMSLVITAGGVIFTGGLGSSVGLIAFAKRLAARTLQFLVLLNMRKSFIKDAINGISEQNSVKTAFGVGGLMSSLSGNKKIKIAYSLLNLAKNAWIFADLYHINDEEREELFQKYQTESMVWGEKVIKGLRTKFSEIQGQLNFVNQTYSQMVNDFSSGMNSLIRQGGAVGNLSKVYNSKLVIKDDQIIFGEVKDGIKTKKITLKYIKNVLFGVSKKINAYLLKPFIKKISSIDKNINFELDKKNNKITSFFDTFDKKLDEKWNDIIGKLKSKGFYDVVFDSNKYNSKTKSAKDFSQKQKKDEAIGEFLRNSGYSEEQINSWKRESKTIKTSVGDIYVKNGEIKLYVKINEESFTENEEERGVKNEKKSNEVLKEWNGKSSEIFDISAGYEVNNAVYYSGYVIITLKKKNSVEITENDEKFWLEAFSLAEIDEKTAKTYAKTYAEKYKEMNDLYEKLNEIKGRNYNDTEYNENDEKAFTKYRNFYGHDDESFLKIPEKMIFNFRSGFLVSAGYDFKLSTRGIKILQHYGVVRDNMLGVNARQYFKKILWKNCAWYVDGIINAGDNANESHIQIFAMIDQRYNMKGKLQGVTTDCFLWDYTVGIASEEEKLYNKQKDFKKSLQMILKTLQNKL